MNPALISMGTIIVYRLTAFLPDLLIADVPFLDSLCIQYIVFTTQNYVGASSK
jgi:hypothetical protein